MGVLVVVSAKVWLGAISAATLVALGVAARSRSEPPPAVAQLPPEVPWLTPEAAAQIIGDHGALGPLFHGVELGGPRPAAAVRARIAAFARANHVAIDLEITDGVVAAVRFDVTFHGCCGYEGADVLALRAARPISGGGCVGGPEKWVNDWAITQDGVHVRAHVDVNRVVLRWSRAATVETILARADELVGADAALVAHESREDWHTIEAHQRYLLELPYAFSAYSGVATRTEELGLQLVADGDRLAEIAFTLRADETGTDVAAQLRSHWGPARVRGGSWTWQKPDRIIEAYVDGGSEVSVTMRARAPGARAIAR
jgi:hypothetical protein